MKKILFTANTLDVGGIETALVNLLNNLVNKYDITLILEKKQGIFLNELNKKINIIEYLPSNSKNVIIRKLINLLKRIKFILKYKNKFDFAASFATYSKMGSFCARTASKNNALWIHSNYLKLYNDDINEVKKFFDFINYENFKKYIFVSENSMNDFNAAFNIKNNKLEIIHNLIDDKKISKKSEENIEIKKEENVVIFLNVARHDESSKKLTRLFEAIEMLKNDNMNFKVLLIGDGPDSKKYEKIIRDKNLDDRCIILGEKVNPYPYYKICDAIVMTSEHEGYPVIFDEARVLGVPIITTNISDASKDINNKYGIVTEKNSKDFYIALKSFINNGFKSTTFDTKEYNKKTIDKLEELIDGGKNAKV